MAGIFKAYDVRGQYPSEINPEIVYKIGKAFVQFIKESPIVVGRDARLSSDELCEALIRGITDAGSDVVSVGRCETPMFYFSIANYKLPAGAMITASHDPKDYNGVKFNKEDAVAISYESGIDKIEKFVEEDKKIKPLKKGKVIEKDVMDDYLNHIRKFGVSDVKGLKIVIDAGNGIGGVVAEKIFDETASEIVKMNIEPDGRFPNRDPNPINEGALVELQRKVVRERADIGIAFDGDSDRVVFVDEEGNYILPDHIICLLAKHFLEKKPGLKILYELRCTRSVKEAIEFYRGRPIISRVGHSYVNEKMIDDNIFFGGETTGHYYYRDNFYSDSAIITAVIVSKILSQSHKKISDLIRPFKRYFKIPEINMHDVKDEKGLIRALESKYPDGKSYHLDGLTVEYTDWWFNIRPSYTEPLVRLMIEANTEELLKEKKEELLEFIESYEK